MNLEQIAHNLTLLKIKQLDLSAYDDCSLCNEYISQFNLFLQNLKIVTSEQYIKTLDNENKVIKECFGDI